MTLIPYPSPPTPHLHYSQPVSLFPRHFRARNVVFIYLVGPYYAGPKSTPAHFTPALISPRANFDLPPFRAAFNATIWKNQKNQKKGKVFNLE